jgi:glycosyltransferase involved in cell wall biosynthesis
MCCGVPVIAAATSSLTEVGGEACLYFAPDDVPSLVSHLNNLADADMRSTIIQNGLVRAESFKTDVIAPQMLNVLGI